MYPEALPIFTLTHNRLRHAPALNPVNQHEQDIIRLPTGLRRRRPGSVRFQILRHSSARHLAKAYRARTTDAVFEARDEEQAIE